jgi:hypothetical protein
MSRGAFTGHCTLATSTEVRRMTRPRPNSRQYPTRAHRRGAESRHTARMSSETKRHGPRAHIMQLGMRFQQAREVATQIVEMQVGNARLGASRSPRGLHRTDAPACFIAEHERVWSEQFAGRGRCVTSPELLPTAVPPARCAWSEQSLSTPQGLATIVESLVGGPGEALRYCAGLNTI